MHIDESYVPQRLQGPMRIVNATGNGSKFRIERDTGWGVVAEDLKVLKVSGSDLELFHEEYVKDLLKSTEIFLKEFKPKVCVATIERLYFGVVTHNT